MLYNKIAPYIKQNLCIHHLKSAACSIWAGNDLTGGNQQ